MKRHENGSDEMFAVRFHGRGGQGVVTAAELPASAAFREDRCAQAFPSFGSERMGAPVMSFCRIDDKPIRTHEPVDEPDALLIQDATLVHQVDLFAGLQADGFVLVNSTQSLAELGLADLAARPHSASDHGARRHGAGRDGDRLRTLPASNLALAHLGRPLPARRCWPASPR
jgi:pyruvate ferredoxin oxidoreductase gamma subunit